MRSAFTKDIFREIRGTMNRFIAILAIVALGVGFFAGLRATTPDMQHTADVYFDDQNFMDFRLLSTMGFTQDDLDSLRKQPYIEGAMAGYAVDVLLESNEGNQATHVMSLPSDPEAADANNINRPILTAGRYPEKLGECVIDPFAAASTSGVPGFGAIGNTVVLSDDNDPDTLDLLASREFTVVGTVDSPLYVSFQRGSTDIGNGSLDYYMMVSEEEFDSEYYLEMFATVRGAEELDTFSSAYDDLIESDEEKLETFAERREQQRYDDIHGEAQQEIDDAESEVADAEADLAQGQADYDSEKAEAERKLSDAEAELADAEAQIASNQARLDSSEAELESGEREYEDNAASFRRQIAQAEARLDNSEDELRSARASYESGMAQLEEGEAQLAALQAQIQQLSDAGMPEEEIAPLQQQAEAASAQIESQRGTLEAAASEIASGESQLRSGRSQLESQRSSGQARLNAARAELDDGWAQLRSGRAALEQAQRELEEGRATYNQEKLDADEQLSEGQRELDDARAEIDDARSEIEDARAKVADIERPEWYILDRDTNIGYANFQSDSQKIENLSGVFPVFFFLVAALVCLTTMTRMVEEQRTQIGVLKALGYGRGRIASKYIVYAALATVAGSIVGLVAGFWVFPTVIWHAYSIMYVMPPIIIAFDWPLALGAGAAATAVTLAAAMWAVYNELVTVPADLIRPKAPPAGKRVLLERISWLWRRLNFTQKVTARNLFRYKKRFVMTLIGIAGCTALMLTGFGLRDSIAGIVTYQFREIHAYDVILTLEEPYTPDQTETESRLSEDLAEHIYISQETGTADANDASVDVILMVPEDPDAFPSFVTFRNRLTKEPVAFPDGDRVVVTEKMADTLGISPGDTVEVTRGETDRAQFTVGGIAENYVYNYVYMTPQIYEEAFGEEPEYRQAFGEAGSEEALTEDEENMLAQTLVADEGINSLSFTSRTSRDFEEMMTSLDAVVWLLIICANLLAFIVLYNLVNINITERTREIATLKVLGFFDKEVSSYVFRENILLSVMGALLGLVLGVFLHQYVVQTAEVDIVMFERDIHLLSYVYSFALTMVFAYVVDWAMHFRLKRISMVESLKSAE